MNKEINEKVSALMDGDLSAAETVDTLDLLCADESLREQWRRAHLARDVLQGETPAYLLGSEFSKGVMDALEEDDTPARTDENKVVSPNIFAREKPSKAAPSWVRPMSGLAIAASVAVVSVMGLKLIQEPGSIGLPLDANVAGNTNFEAGTVVAQLPNQPVSNADFKRVNNTGTYWVVDQKKVRDSELESHLNSYLSDHIEFATMRNVGGMLPYSRLVGYDEVRK